MVWFCCSCGQSFCRESKLSDLSFVSFLFALANGFISFSYFRKVAKNIFVG